MISKKIKRLMAYLSVFTFFSTAGIVHIDVKAQTEQNLALNKAAKSIRVIGNNTANLAVDGDANTYWEAANYPQYLEVDLGESCDITGIKVVNKLGAAYKYRIYVSSDGENFIKIAEKYDTEIATTDGKMFEVTAEGRFVRISIVYNSANENANIAELQVYGRPNGKATPKKEPISTTDFQSTPYAERLNKLKTDKEYAAKAAIEEVKGIVTRVIGEKYLENFKFEVISAADGNDVFELENGSDGKVIIRGNNGIAMASGLNWYLRYFCKVNYTSTTASNVKMPSILPKINEKVRTVNSFKNRYAYNFCTFSYSMAFWNWEEYQRELDWMALNGVNMPLSIVGQEEVMRRTLKRFNYKDEEIKNYISGPGYYAWYYMQNLTGWGGALPNTWFSERTELSRKLNDRMAALGMQPVLQGFSGMVPTDFNLKNPGANVIPQGNWCGYQRPYMIRTYVNEGQRDYFSEVADAFYEEQTKLFGDVTNYYATDPFHEGGNKADLDVAKVAKIVQKKMMDNDPEAVWVKQSWQDSLRDQLPGVDKNHMLILDLYSEVTTYRGSDEFMGTPWVWNLLNNFGGRMGMNGVPKTIAENIINTKEKSKYMVGIGITPEAVGTNPLMFDMLFDMQWRKDTVNYRQWVYDYIESRYGKKTDKIIEAWNLWLDTAYSKNPVGQGAPESIINARPRTGIDRASTWGGSTVPYDKAKFEEVVKLFIESYEDLKGSDAFLYDFADVTRQLLSNSSQEYYNNMMKAYNDKNIGSFSENADTFLGLVKLQDKVLATREENLLGKWIEASRTMLDGADDWTKDLFEFNARALVTTWGGRAQAEAGGLHDYSNRQWAGLTGDFYYTRWQMWLNNLKDALQGKQTQNIDWFKWEYDWVNKAGNGYAVEPSKDNIKELSRLAYENYSVNNIKQVQEEVAIPSVNLALNKPAACDKASEKVPANAVDGNLQTLWIASGTNYPVTLSVDLGTERDFNKIELELEKIGLRFKYRVDIEDGAGNRTCIVDRTATVNDMKTDIINLKGRAKKVMVVITGKTEGGSAPLAWPAIAELRVLKVPENLAVGSGVVVEATSESQGSEAIKVKDNENTTSWLPLNTDLSPALIFDLTKKKDILGFEMVTAGTVALKYIVEGSDDKGTWKVIHDSSSNTVAKANYISIFDKMNVFNRYIRVKVKNDSPLPIAEVKIYEKEVTGTLLTYISSAENIKASAVVGDKSGNYPQEAVDKLAAVIAEAKLKATSKLNTDEVAEAIKQINDALYDFYISAKRINRNILAVLIGSTEEYIASIDLGELNDTAKAALNSLTAKLGEAKTVFYSTNISQASLDASYTNLDNIKKSVTEIIEKESQSNTVAKGMSLEFNKEVVKYGEEMVVKLKVDEAKDLYAFYTILNYDAELFTLEGVTLNNEFAAGNKYIDYVDDNGRLKIVATKTGASIGVTGDVKLVDIRLRAKEASGTAKFTIAKESSLSNSQTTINVLSQDISGYLTVSSSEI